MEPANGAYQPFPVLDDQRDLLATVRMNRACEPSLVLDTHRGLLATARMTGARQPGPWMTKLLVAVLMNGTQLSHVLDKHGECAVGRGAPEWHPPTLPGRG